MESLTVPNMDGTGHYIQTIEWDMMNKYKFFPLSMLSSFSVRCLLYPFTVIKTRIQIQRHSEVYKGTFDAFHKIFKYEGVGSLYKGFWISAFQLVSGIFYITTYENVRYFLQQRGVKNSRMRALVGGGCASLVGQTIIVPFDIISQHIMVLGQLEGRGNSKVVNPLNIDYINRRRSQIALDIIRNVYKMDGIRGFYRGYMASISAYVPNSALWWSFYHFYQEPLAHTEILLQKDHEKKADSLEPELEGFTKPILHSPSQFVTKPLQLMPLAHSFAEQLAHISPEGTSTLLLQCIAAPLGGVTTVLLTNPLDTVRARLQVQRTVGFMRTFQVLWREEQLGIFRKGLSPRLFQSVIFSFTIILGYESVKRFSVNEEYKKEVRW